MPQVPRVKTQKDDNMTLPLLTISSLHLILCPWISQAKEVEVYGMVLLAQVEAME